MANVKAAAYGSPSVAVLMLLFGTYSMYSASANTFRHSTFTRVSSTTQDVVTIATHTTPSVISCNVKCVDAVSSVYFVYNTVSKACRCGVALTAGTLEDFDDLYVLDNACRSDIGFQIYTSGSVWMCLWPSSSQADYNVASQACSQKGGARLMVADTVEKVFLFLNQIY